MIRDEDQDDDRVEGEAEAASGPQPDAESPSDDASETVDPAALASALARTRDDLDRTKAELSEMTARLRAVSRKFQEQKDEMASFRSRLEERSRIERAQRKAEVVRTFFDPVQNLARSLESGADGHGLREGVSMIHKQFMDALHQLGLATTPGRGERFDPNLHEAIGVVPVHEPELDDRVVEVHVDGWMVDGRAIQAAKVTVGKYQAPEPMPEA